VHRTISNDLLVIPPQTCSKLACRVGVPYLAVSEHVVFPLLPEVGEMSVAGQEQVARDEHPNMHVDRQHLIHTKFTVK